MTDRLTPVDFQEMEMQLDGTEPHYLVSVLRQAAQDAHRIEQVMTYCAERSVDLGLGEAHSGFVDACQRIAAILQGEG